MFKNGFLFGLGWFIAKDIVQNAIPGFVEIFANGLYTNLSKKCKSGEIKTVSEVIEYIRNYDEFDSNKTENKIKNGIGF